MNFETIKLIIAYVCLGVYVIVYCNLLFGG
jgi:hypothetical protein